MKQMILVSTISILAACNTASNSPQTADTRPIDKTLVIGDEKQISSESLPSEIKVRVTISSRADLHVKAGDKLKSGDVIADRTRERNALENQKRQVENSLRRLQILLASRGEELQKPVLPEASFAEQQAAISRAAVLLEAAKRNIRTQENRIEEIKRLPFPADLSKITQHETARLKLLQGELLEAESNLALEKAKLETARANRTYTEQKDAIEIQKQKIAQNEQRLSLETQIAGLEAQITNLDSQIAALSAVRAPFAGTIKKINWEGQNNAEINVVIVVDVDDSDSSTK
jgi:biotin carboxyl carrier protein